MLIDAAPVKSRGVACDITEKERQVPGKREEANTHTANDQGVSVGEDFCSAATRRMQ